MIQKVRGKKKEETPDESDDAPGGRTNKEPKQVQVRIIYRATRGKRREGGRQSEKT